MWRGGRVIIAVCAALFSGVAARTVAAQDWATRAVCDMPEIGVFDRVFAPATRAEVEAAGAEIANPLGRFWRVVSPNGAVSHLWGTMHSSDPRVLDLPDLVEARIAEAEVVALEIDPILPTRAAVADQQQRSDWFRDDDDSTSLTDLGLDPKVLQWIRLRSAGLGWGEDAPEFLTPGGLAELLLSDPCHDFAAGVLPVQDSRIQMLAMIGGADILALEDRDRIRRKMDDPDSTDFAVDFLSVYGSYLNPNTIWQERATQIALYLSGRLGDMLAWDQVYVSDALGDNGATLARVNRYLLDERNHAFLAAAQDGLQDGGMLMAVGGFHLPGDQGLIALLRRQGFTVTRIPVPGEVRTLDARRNDISLDQLDLGPADPDEAQP
ncbi:TraB/GumN family protein [Marinovum sp. 2_MG-2023]|uniref:TraB/GumN family protein n=1 Tax=Marinovum sp. 1_MG-2023 TaxID=3062633 RepID=UPI0026E2B089|nr:TraB/GumN family protein [Marinovum sp. 1_MG-2023]MDO6728394.1 TraB/GumN family protein [Marinovum sp. 2_MG-2023]MDO6778190.1 TraB/GumN family protein [Marinovum sp. 1_MG-2023]